MLPQIDALVQRFAADVAHRARVVVAVSGGPDSQALLAFASLAASRGACTLVAAIGIDHGLRAEATMELAVARGLATRLGVPFVQRRVSLAGRGNVLARARRERMRALRQEAHRLGAQTVLLGHTQDDHAETVLWHALRGSLPTAFVAMPRRRGLWLRPLLGVSRHALQQALAERQIPFALDPSNEQPARMRARMRQHLWPAIERAMPGGKTQLMAGLEAVQDEQRLLARLAGRTLRRAETSVGGRPALSLPELRRAPRALWPRVLRLFLLRHHARPRPRHLAELAQRLASPTGPRPGRRPPQYALPGGQVAYCEAWLWLCAADELAPRGGGRALGVPRLEPVVLTEGAWHRLGPLRVRLWHEASLGPSPEARSEALHRFGALAPRDAMTVAFARESLHVALLLRPASASEFLDAFGAVGRVQVAKLLASAKLPLAERRMWPMVATTDEAVWLVGIRRGKQATIDVLKDGPVTLLQAEWCREVKQP